MKNFIKYIILVVLTMPQTAQAQYSENAVKAVFLERFTRFIEWPSIDFQENEQNQFVIGIVNGSLIEKEITDLYEVQKIKESPVKIIYLSSPDSLDLIQSCNLIFIEKHWGKKVKNTLDKIYGKPILTVGDGHEFSKDGVMIILYTQNNQVRFKINVDSVRNAGLKIDYRLLDFASNNDG